MGCIEDNGKCGRLTARPGVVTLRLQKDRCNENERRMKGRPRWALSCEGCGLTDPDVLFSRYLSRFNDELEQIELQNDVRARQGRRHCAREAAIRQTVQRERQQFQGYGFGVSPGPL